MRLIFIHGRALGGKDPRQMQREWELTLEKGLGAAGLKLPKGISAVLPFYGDRLDEFVAEYDMPLVADAVQKGSGGDSKEATFRAELLSEIARGCGIRDEDIQRHYVGDPNEKGPLNWKWVHSILKALDATPLGSLAIDAFTRDVHVYLAYSRVREAIDSIVLEELNSEPSVVIGHSLGSVVGYSVLSQVSYTASVQRYVTVGSPLGLDAIKKRLSTPLRMPAKVQKWFNASDVRDVVALYPLDAAHFAIKPGIIKKRDTNNHTSNRHGIAGYLADPTVAQWIFDGLK